jgi:hypothetical protein
VKSQHSSPGAPSIVVVPESHLGRERQSALHKNWILLRSIANVTILSPQITENELLLFLDQHPTHLILLPWSKYLSWSKVEGYFGLTRNSGPTAAGYFGTPLERHEIGALNEYHRIILLDFASTQFSERLKITRALLDERKRSGIRPLLEPKSVVYFEDWRGSHPPGATLDSLIALPALRQEPWRTRLSSIQLIAWSFWNLAFEHGRALARGDWLSKMHESRVRAYFEIGLDSEFLTLRLCYQQNPNTPKTLLRDFWPEGSQNPPSDSRQMLLQHADLLRIHPISDDMEIEIVAVLMRSAPAAKRPGELRTLWIEPLARSLISEIPTSRNPEWHNLEKPLSILNTWQEGELRGALELAQRRILWLEQEVREREQRIHEMIAGGLSHSTAIPKKEG